MFEKVVDILERRGREDLSGSLCACVDGLIALLKVGYPSELRVEFQEELLAGKVPVEDSMSVARVVALFAWPYYQGYMAGGSRVLSGENHDFIYWAKSCTSCSEVSFALMVRAKSQYDERVKEIKQFEGVLADRIDGKISGLDELSLELSSLKGELDIYLKKANFANLSEGLGSLIGEYQNTHKWRRNIVLVLAIALVIIPFLVVYHGGIPGNDVISFAKNGIGLLGLELVMLYFLRINLADQKGLAAQLLQMKIRRACLQFVEHYVDFKSSKGVGDMEKFEALIFSNIVSEPDNIPPVLDGVDQLSRLIDSVRRPSK